MDIDKIQKILCKEGLDGWIFTDFHDHDFITKKFCQLTDRACTRRLFYYIPAEGEPIKVISAIEPLLLDHLPGKKVLYKGLKEQNNALSDILKPGLKLACQYSEGGDVPTICSMDGGMVDYLKSFGVKLISSADIMQYFEAVLTDEEIESHRRAGVIIHRILDGAFRWIRESLDAGLYIDEWALLKKFEQLIAQEDIYMDTPPFFGIDDHASDPGYEPSPEGSYQIKEGSRLIVDIEGRLPQDNAVFYDVSWCANVGPDISAEYQQLFDTVNDVRFRAVDYIQSHLDKGESVRGCDVDAFVQKEFEKKNLSQYIMHRTGHNIGHTCHGLGANLDNYETRDTRSLLPCTMFSVEPGIYTENIGVRLEYDVYIDSDRKTKIFGPVQKEIVII